MRAPERRESARVAADGRLEICNRICPKDTAPWPTIFTAATATIRRLSSGVRRSPLGRCPTTASCSRARPTSWRRQGRFEEATPTLEKALEIQPKSDWIAAELAQTYTTMRRYEAADRLYRLAISLAPDLPAPYHSRARNFLLWRGDTAAARKTLEGMPRQDASSSLLAWFHLEVAQRDYRAAAQRLENNNIKATLLGVESAHYPRDLLRAFAYRRLGEAEVAEALFENARLLLERHMPQGEADPRKRITLGMTYAGLGRKDDAIREATQAVAQYPISGDAFIGPRYVDHLAKVYIMVGEPEAALDHIEYLLSIPSDVSVPLLTIGPQWDPLRDHPRFQALVGDSR